MLTQTTTAATVQANDGAMLAEAERDARVFLAFLLKIAIKPEAVAEAVKTAGPGWFEQRAYTEHEGGTDFDEVAETLRDRVLRLVAPGAVYDVIAAVLVTELAGETLAESVETWDHDSPNWGKTCERVAAALQDRIAERVFDALEAAGLILPVGALAPALFSGGAGVD